MPRTRTHRFFKNAPGAQKGPAPDAPRFAGRARIGARRQLRPKRPRNGSRRFCPTFFSSGASAPRGGSAGGSGRRERALRRDDDVQSEQLGAVTRQLLVAEVVPTAAGLVLSLLNVAGERKPVHGLARQLPLVPREPRAASGSRPASASRCPRGACGAPGSFELAGSPGRRIPRSHCDPAHRVVFVRQREQKLSERPDRPGSSHDSRL